MSSQSPPAPPGSNATVMEQTLSFLGAAATYMRLPALASTGFAVILTAVLYFKQKSLIYPSNVPVDARIHVALPSDVGFTDFDNLVLPTKDGEKLSAFYIRGPPDGLHRHLTVLMFHGNAGNIGHRLPLARQLVRHVGCNVFMLEYRGYGLSTGQADEHGLALDAQTALDYLRNRAETRSQRFVVFGQSLGGAVGIHLVSKNQDAGDIVGLILENTFLSLRKLIPDVMPPAKYLSMLCHQVWASDALLPSINKIPTLFLSGLKDQIVPPKHMAELFKLSVTPVKIWKPLPNGDHNACPLEAGYFEAIHDFIVQLASRSSSLEKKVDSVL